MKIIKIIIGLLLISSTAIAAYNIEVHINYPTDTVYIGSYNQLEIWIENDTRLNGMSLGLEFDTYSGTIIWDPDYGDIPPAQIENDAIGNLSYIFNPLGFEDNLLPDSILFGGPYLPDMIPGLPANSMRKCITFRFYIPDTAPLEDFCVDNIFIPNYGYWLFEDDGGEIVPDYFGCQNSSQSNPDCPAVCFPVRSDIWRMCGDINGDFAVNVSDFVYLLDYIFHNAPMATPWVQADVTCNGRVNISDVAYLIAYLFAGGNFPCANCP